MDSAGRAAGLTADRRTVQLGLIFAVGWAICVAVLWSQRVYDLHAVRASLLLAVPWFLATAALQLAASPEAAVPLDVQRLAVEGPLRSMTYAPGEIVAGPPDIETTVYIITAGRARVLVDDDHGHQIEVCELLEGDVFGALGVLAGPIRSVWLEAIDPSSVLVWDAVRPDSRHTPRSPRPMGRADSRTHGRT